MKMRVNTRSSEKDYEDLKKVVEEAGFFADFQQIKVPGDRLCLASKRLENGFTGVLFWVAKRGADWFIATYLPHLYRIPDAKSVAELVVAVLRKGGGTPYDLADELKTRFSLVEISEKQFKRL
jgi:hypothetical protein